MGQFTLTFGQRPQCYIERNSVDLIYSDFSLDYPLSHVYMISGVRGSGKTVMLTNVVSHYQNDKEWVVVNVNPNREILEQIASRVYDSENVHHLFLKKTFGISFHGLTFSIEGDNPVTSVMTVLDRMFDSLKKNKKKILIAMDELGNNAFTRSFFHDFQSMLRDEWPVYCVAAGLYKNVSSLQNNKALTFLYRSPKIILPLLSLEKVERNYKTVFKNEKDAQALAELTNGYPFAFQVAGYLYGKYGNIEKIIPEYDSYLSLYVYDKVWDSIPKNERDILKAFTSKTMKTMDLLTGSGFSQKEYSVYRDRLNKRGIIDCSVRGKVSLVLPRFLEFIKRQVS